MLPFLTKDGHDLLSETEISSQMTGSLGMTTGGTRIGTTETIGTTEITGVLEIIETIATAISNLIKESMQKREATVLK